MSRTNSIATKRSATPGSSSSTGKIRLARAPTSDAPPGAPSPLVRPGSQLFQFVFSALLNRFTLRLGISRIRLQQLQRLLRILSRQILLPVSKIRIGKAVVYVWRVRISDSIELEDFHPSLRVPGL